MVRIPRAGMMLREFLEVSLAERVAHGPRHCLAQTVEAHTRATRVLRVAVLSGRGHIGSQLAPASTCISSSLQHNYEAFS